MKRRALLVPAAILSALVLVGPAQGQMADFSPTTGFKLSSRKGAANPAITIDVAQDAGEESLAHVTLRVPAGFKLPGDAAIENGELLGTGSISINVGLDCQTGQDITPDLDEDGVTLIERDRTEDETANGTVAVWVLDIPNVTTIELFITGSKGAGWAIDGDIPETPITCPPFVFSATVNPTSENGTKILVNPKPRRTKAYTFAAEYLSTEDSAFSQEQKIKIRGRRRR